VLNAIIVGRIYFFFFSSIVVLTPNGQFLNCATTALGEQYVTAATSMLYPP